MNAAFPDADVEGYEIFIPTLTLPDPDDRHVLAAALRFQADVIVTTNLKDFPVPYLRTFDVEVQHPDEFVGNFIDLNSAKALEAFRQQVARLMNPPIAAFQVLDNLRKSSLPTTADRLGFLVAAGNKITLSSRHLITTFHPYRYNRLFCERKNSFQANLRSLLHLQQ